MKDPVPSNDPGDLNTSSQIINKLEITSLPAAAKKSSEALPENKDLHEELSSQGANVEAATDKRFLQSDIT